MDEGIVEGCEDTGDAEDEFTCEGLSILMRMGGRQIFLTFSDLGT